MKWAKARDNARTNLIYDSVICETLVTITQVMARETYKKSGGVERAPFLGVYYIYTFNECSMSGTSLLPNRFMRKREIILKKERHRGDQAQCL